AYLMPSQQESFGVAALEAEAIGLPILAARTGGIPEVVREGVTAQFVEPLTAHALADAMVALQRGSSLLQSAWDEGPRWVHENYEWSTCVRQMEEVYAS
ncbi:MAG: glycosyltransferase, partial [Candidatus Andersenbacteria bacterium]